MWNGGDRNRTPDPLISGHHALPPAAPDMIIHSYCIYVNSICIRGTKVEHESRVNKVNDLTALPENRTTLMPLMRIHKSCS